MSNYRVEICGVNTSALPLLKESEKEALFLKILEGDMNAREEYIQCNLRLVLSITRRFTNTTENIDDLFQIGCIGLIKAIDNFDINQNVKFSTYAVPMIIGEIRRYLRDNSPIRISRSLKDIAYKALNAKENLSKETSKEPTLEDISKVINIPPEDIAIALEAIQAPVSLYEPVYNDNGDTLCVCDQVSDKKNHEDNWVTDISIKDAIKKLPNREKEIIVKRFFQGKTQVEVSKEIAISQAQVSRLEKNALKTMQKYLS